MPKLTGYHDLKHEKLTVRHAHTTSAVYTDDLRRINFIIEGDGSVYIGLTTPAAVRLITKLSKLVAETV